MTNDQPMFSPELASKIRSLPVIAVLMIDDADSAVPLAQAILKGGVKCMELTLRTDAALEAARRVKEEVPEMILGLGTVLTPDQVKAAKEIGADFAVSPGLNPRVLQAARDNDLSFAPGIMTPSDIEAALEFNCKILKFFPAEPSGGLKFLRTIAAPYAHKKLSYIPLGGINSSNMADYLSDPYVHSIGGSWIAAKQLIQAGDWHGITENAKIACDKACEIMESKS